MINRCSISAIGRSPALLLAAGIGLACSAPHRVAHEMTWEIRAPDAGAPAHVHVVLRFVKFPQHSFHIFSRDLADYLRAYPGSTVPVVFDLWPGCRPAFNPVQVGELKRWEVSRTDMYEVDDSDAPSPWGERSCWFDWWKG